MRIAAGKHQYFSRGLMAMRFIQRAF